MLDELGVRRRVQIRVTGWLPLPFVVAGTDLVAIVPERLAHRVADPAGVLVVEPPFGTVELIEAAWWHPTGRPIPRCPGCAGSCAIRRPRSARRRGSGLSPC